jgi:hypothetical protein
MTKPWSRSRWLALALGLAALLSAYHFVARPWFLENADCVHPELDGMRARLRDATRRHAEPRASRRSWWRRCSRCGAGRLAARGEAP